MKPGVRFFVVPNSTHGLVDCTLLLFRLFFVRSFVYSFCLFVRLSVLFACFFVHRLNYTLSDILARGNFL